MAPSSGVSDRRSRSLARTCRRAGGPLWLPRAGRSFKAETPLATLEQVRSAELVPPTRLRPQVPARPGNNLCEMLQRSPDRRYPSAAALAEDLRAAARAANRSKRGPGDVGMGVKWARRRPAAALLSRAGAAALGWL